jgi:hypothetical protein
MTMPAVLTMRDLLAYVWEYDCFPSESPDDVRRDAYELGYLARREYLSRGNNAKIGRPHLTPEGKAVLEVDHE